MKDYARSDVYPPEVEAMGEMRGCTDEDHAFGCPCRVGGDPILEWTSGTTGVRDPRRRRDVDRNVSLSDGTIIGCCDTCWERGEEAVLMPLDYTEDDDDD